MGEAFCDEGVDIDFYTTRVRNVSEPLPWDHIDTRVKRDFLIIEWQKASKGEHTADCRSGDCSVCGVCDFDFIEPKIFETCIEETEKSLWQDDDKRDDCL